MIRQVCALQTDSND